MITLLEFNLVQDIWFFQRFSGLGNEHPQTGHTLSSGLTITVSLHLGHLTGWTFTRLISLGSRLVIRFLLGIIVQAVFRFNIRLEKSELFLGRIVRRNGGARTKALRQRILPVAVPTEDIVIANRPRDMLVCAWTLFGRVWGERNFLCHCYSLVTFESFL